MNRVRTDEQRSLYDAARHFARERLMPGYVARDAPGALHQQRLRDVMGYKIGDGTAEIMNRIIARRRQSEFGASHRRGLALPIL